MRDVNAGRKRLVVRGTPIIAPKQKSKKELHEEKELLGPSTPLTTPKMRKCTGLYCGKMTYNYYFCQDCYYRKKYAGCEVSEDWAGF